MKKIYYPLFIVFFGLSTTTSFAQGDWSVRGNAFGYFVGEINAQVEYRVNENFGINFFGGARPFELNYLDEDFSKLANRFLGLEARVYTKDIAGLHPFLFPYLKYSYYRGVVTSEGIDNNGNPVFPTQNITDHYVYIGLGFGFREQLSDHFFTEVTFALARGVYGNIRDGDGLRIIPERSRLDARFGVLLGYTFGK